MLRGMNNPASSYALITGATSGIGYELARLFAQNHKNVIIVARLPEQLAAVKAELTREFAVDVRTIAADLFDPEAPGAVFAAVRDAGLVVDVLVNNAGQGEHGEFAGSDLARQLAIVQLNVASLVALTHHFLRDMQVRRSGRLLLLGSSYSKVPGPLMAVYAATKAFVLSFGEALRNEVKDYGVAVTVLMPGATDTDFFHKAGGVRSKIYAESRLADPADVARDGYAALMAGEGVVVSGFKNKVQAFMADVTPHSVIAEKARASAEPTDRPAEEVRTHSTHAPSQRERAALEAAAVR